MRAPLRPVLLAAACLAAAGCASAPKDVLPVAAEEPACEHDPADQLHMASSRPDTERDWQVEAIMSQEPTDPRLVLVNRQMYLSLHALDVELRREQRIAECEDPESSPPTLEAEARDGSGSGAAEEDGSPGGLGAYPMGGGTVASSPAPSAPTASQNSGAPPAAGSTSLRKTSLSAPGGGGNGATAQKVNPVSDNDIVARRLRKAAEQETNPDLRAKLWKEYADYRQGMTGK
jgi:hypothetical protein